MKPFLTFLLPVLLIFIAMNNVNAQNYNITTTASTIEITDLSGNGETITITESAGNIRFTTTPNTRTYSINGGATTAFSTPASISLAGKTQITINAAGGNDIITFGVFVTSFPSLTIHGGTGDDIVNFNGNINFITDANLDIDMQNDDAVPGLDRVSFGANAQLNLTGSGSVNIKVSKDISMNSNNVLRTVNGNLTMETNQQVVPSEIGVTGINVNNSSIIEITGTGILSMKGKGGTVGSIQYGISVGNRSKISGGTTGATLIEGIGGAAPVTANYGIQIFFGGIITSSGSNISINGIGGGAGTAGGNVGVFVHGGTVTAGGNGNVNINGLGATTPGNSNGGVSVNGDTSMITSSGGNVIITGLGQGTGATQNNLGVLVANKGIITAGGNGTVTITGTGSGDAGTNTNHGVYVLDATISSSGGNISVSGLGGGSGSSNNNHGVSLQLAGIISAGDNGMVTIEGTGGSSMGGSNFGVYVNGAGSLITSLSGDVHVTGTKGVSSPNTPDINILNSGAITSTSGDVILTSTTAGTRPSSNGTDVSTSGSNTLSFGNNSVLYLVINNTTVNTGYNQLNVIGKVNLNNATLSFEGSTHVPVIGQTFTIVGNDGSDPIIGTFAGLPQGAIIYNFLGSAHNATITYTGGSNNDVVLTVVSCSLQTWYLDADNDGYYVSSTSSCTNPGAGYNQTATILGDCNDDNTAAHAIGTWYLDFDNDGHYISSLQSCGSPGTGYNTTATQSGDCDDSNIYKWQSALLYIDFDNDNYDNGTATVCYGASIPTGYKFNTNGIDCNDLNILINPSAIEICDAIDNDCDGLVDNADPGITGQVEWFADADGDGFGDPAESMMSCYPPSDHVDNDLDCDDSNPDIHPGAEICNGIDDDCDGDIDDGLSCVIDDGDGDGIEDTVDNCPSTENPTQADSDCDGVGDACDLCPGGDDAIDANHDGLPDCHYLPAYANIIPSWKCAGNKVYISHEETNGTCNSICVSYNAAQAHINHGDYLGPCGNSHCNQSYATPESNGEANVADEQNGVYFSLEKEITDNVNAQHHSNETTVNDLSLVAYPNPANASVTIEFISGGQNPYSLQMMDMTGRLMVSESIHALAGLNRYKMNLESMNPGIYIIRGDDGESTIGMIKLVIQ